MRFRLLIGLFLLSAYHLYSQPEIKVLEKDRDLQAILTDSIYHLPFIIINTGNEPLIITRFNTSDGGFFPGRWPKEPIMPGDSAVVEGIFDTRSRNGYFSKSGYIQSNAETNRHITLSIKGYIRFRPTSIFLYSSAIPTKSIQYGTTDTMRFYFQLKGPNPIQQLVLETQEYLHPELLMYSIHGVPGGQKKFNGYTSGDSFEIRMIVRNIYGNTGAFKSRYKLICNGDTSWIPFELYFTGIPFEVQRIENDRVYIYEKNQLKRIYPIRQTANTEGGYYLNGECVKVILINPYYGHPNPISLTRIYKNGMMVEERKE